MIETDDFASWQNVTGWWPRFDRDVLTPLLARREAQYQVRDWENDKFGSSLNGFKTVAWAPLVIVEGVTCRRSAADGRICYRIWVEAPEDVRLERGIERDGETHRSLWLQWMREEADFFARDRTGDLADLILVGAPEVPHDPERNVVASD